MSDRDSEASPNARLLTVLIWAGVGLAPVAALIVLLGGSDNSIRFAVLLVAVCVVLIGAALLIRNDPVLLKMDVEDRVEALREELREEITASAHASGNRVRALQDEMTRMRAAGSPAMGLPPAPPRATAAPNAASAAIPGRPPGQAPAATPPGRTTGPVATPGRTTGPIATPGRTTGPVAMPGRAPGAAAGAAAAATPGRPPGPAPATNPGRPPGSAPAAPPGRPGGPAATPGRPGGPAATPGRTGGPAATPGRPGGPAVTPGRPAGPAVAPGRTGGPAAMPGRPPGSVPAALPGRSSGPATAAVPGRAAVSVPGRTDDDWADDGRTADTGDGWTADASDGWTADASDGWTDDTGWTDDADNGWTGDDDQAPAPAPPGRPAVATASVAPPGGHTAVARIPAVGAVAPVTGNASAPRAAGSAAVASAAVPSQRGSSGVPPTSGSAYQAGYDDEAGTAPHEFGGYGPGPSGSAWAERSEPAPYGSGGYETADPPPAEPRPARPSRRHAAPDTGTDLARYGLGSPAAPAPQTYGTATPEVHGSDYGTDYGSDFGTDFGTEQTGDATWTSAGGYQYADPEAPSAFGIETSSFFAEAEAEAEVDPDVENAAGAHEDEPVQAADYAQPADRYAQNGYGPDPMGPHHGWAPRSQEHPGRW